MPWINNVLVIAGEMLGSDELHAAMLAEARRTPTQFVLVAPRRTQWRRAQGDGASAGVHNTVRRACEDSLDVTIRFGDDDPVVAAAESYDPARFDKIIVGTGSARLPQWTLPDVIVRTQRLTGAPVSHVCVDARSGSPTRPPCNSEGVTLAA